MTPEQEEQLVDMILVTAEVMGHELKPSAVMMMVSDLSGYDFAAVANTLNRCRKEQTGRLTLKGILDLLAPAGGWLTANEAWSLALPAADERNTVVWTSEASKAWSVALPLLEVGDKVGARMAFIAAYERHVSTAKSEGKQPVHEVSAGWDAAGRDLAIQQAQIAGLLPPPAPVAALPPPTKEQQAALVDNRAKVQAGLQALASKMRAANEPDRIARERERAERMEKANAYFEKQEREGH
jgi:hypothetical protein